MIEAGMLIAGRQVVKMTSAIASQPIWSIFGSDHVPCAHSMTKQSPPRPAIMLPTMVARYLYRVTLMPAASAVAGFSPTARSCRPVRLYFKNSATRIATTIAE